MTKHTRDYPYYRLSLFYLLFFMALGIFVPYWSLYLQFLQFSAAEIGELMAIAIGSKVVAPYLWGWLADHTGWRIQIIRLTALLSGVFFAGVFIEQSYFWMAFIMALFGFFWNACLPLFEALTLNHLQQQVTHYSHIRIWGSLGFIFSVVGLPLLFEAYDFVMIPITLLIALILMGLSTLLVNDRAHLLEHLASPPIWRVIRQPVVIAFLVVCTLQIASHGAYYTFFSIYLLDQGYSALLTGWMWAVGVIAEIGLFIIMHRVLMQYDAGVLLTLSLLGTAVRWFLLAYFVDVWGILLFVQLLHAISFGLFHAAAIHLVHTLFPARLQGRGQALYAGLCFGVGGVVGNLLSGYAWDYLGSLTTFLSSGVVALVGGAIAWFFIANVSLNKEQQIC